MRIIAYLCLSLVVSSLLSLIPFFLHSFMFLLCSPRGISSCSIHRQGLFDFTEERRSIHRLTRIDSIRIDSIRIDSKLIDSKLIDSIRIDRIAFSLLCYCTDFLQLHLHQQYKVAAPTFHIIIVFSHHI